MKNETLKIMSVYTQATGSSYCIYDHNYKPLPGTIGEFDIENTVCPCCVKFRAVAGSDPLEAYPCHEMHLNAIREANRRGGSHVYQCELGFVFWTSPIYTEGSFTGALRGSGFLSDEQNAGGDHGSAGSGSAESGEKSAVMCNGEISADEFRRRIAVFPRGDNEKIKSLAEMLLLCAESLSSGSEDYHEILRRRAEQQQIIAALIGELQEKYPAGSTMPGYPLEKERGFIAALRRGDSKSAAQILNELLAILIFTNPGHFRYIQLRATELVVLLSRAEISPGRSGNLSLETNSFKHVQEAKTIEELTDILHIIVERISGLISSFQGIPHAAALRKAEHFIMENYTRKVSLQEIADIAGLSAPYFSTIFKEEMGENLSKYLNRLRVERASRLLLETDMSLSEIAGACCFEDQSWFSKIFKAFTGFSPGRYRNQGGGMVREISESNLSEEFLKTMK
ncbi:hypothetical protein AGMMS50293_21250 [Spirochaetia bacterium]|nr:hypothetical protein AGMMS50293_21250 [Spirochaetia bacterium]